MRRIAPFLIALACLAGCRSNEVGRDADQVVTGARHAGDGFLDFLFGGGLSTTPPAPQTMP